VGGEFGWQGAREQGQRRGRRSDTELHPGEKKPPFPTPNEDCGSEYRAPFIKATVPTGFKTFW
jgi:hypothetical protein